MSMIRGGAEPQACCDNVLPPSLLQPYVNMCRPPTFPPLPRYIYIRPHGHLVKGAVSCPPATTTKGVIFLDFLWGMFDVSSLSAMQKGGRPRCLRRQRRERETPSALAVPTSPAFRCIWPQWYRYVMGGCDQPLQGRIFLFFGLLTNEPVCSI